MNDPSTIDRPDGRTLSFAEYGSPDGAPVFCFHGVLGSRLLWSLFDDAAASADVRVIAPERPGFGHSSFQRGRSLLDWPDDVGALADHLGIDRFGVVGFSGGGPHALACASAMPERVRTVVPVSSVTPPETHGHADPFNHGFLTATRLVPGFSRAAFESAGWLASHSRSQFRAGLVRSSAPPDRALFDGPEGDALVGDAVEAFRQSGRGPAHDLPTVGSDWGFDPRDVSTPAALWHGREDATVDADMARAFADLLPSADLHLTADAHYSTLLNNRESVLAAATGR